MNITSNGLVKAAGAAAVAAGTIFIAVQINHPAHDAFTTETSAWVARSGAKAASNPCLMPCISRSMPPIIRPNRNTSRNTSRKRRLPTFWSAS